MKTLEQYIEQYGPIDGPKRFKKCQQDKVRNKTRYANDPEFKAKQCQISNDYHKARYNNDPEYRAKQLSRYKDNPEYAERNRLNSLKYSLKKQAAGKVVYKKPLVSSKMKSHKKKYNYCEICGCKENLECHHIIPITLENYEIYREDPNIITVCKNCHHDIHHGDLQVPEELIIKLDNYLEEVKVKDNLDGSESNNGL